MRSACHAWCLPLNIYRSIEMLILARRMKKSDTSNLIEPTCDGVHPMKQRGPADNQAQQAANWRLERQAYGRRSLSCEGLSEGGPNL